MSKDHKRKVDPREHLAPAIVRADDEGSIWVIVGDIVGKNEAHVHRQGGGRAASKATDRYREAVRLGLVAMTLRHEMGDVAALTHPGPWHLDVLGVWPRRRSKEAMAKMGFPADAEPLPLGDLDACISQAMDALQRSGIISDDARITSGREWTVYRKGVRATVMRLARADAFPVTRAGMLVELENLAP